MTWLNRDDRTALRAPLIRLSTYASSVGPEEMEWALSHETPPGGLICVTSGSPISYRRAVTELAHYFRREFQYDFVQYDVQVEPSARAFLWLTYRTVEESARVVGACCFRWRVYRDTKCPPRWAMQWIWLHPYHRRRGLLSAMWPYFKRRFGEFNVEGPLSEAMDGFLQKQGYFTTEELLPHEHPAG